jgi:NDP-sugar pyrophosphorylase family protein
MSHDKAKCLFPLANIPLILFQLELLAINGVTEVIIVSSRDSNVLKEQIDRIKNSHKIGKKTNFNI